MKRRILSLLALILILSSVLAIPASADDTVGSEAASVTPRYVNIALFTASCGVNSSGKAASYAFVETANSSYTIYLNMTLQRYEDGYWTNVKSWSSSGTGEVTMDKGWYVLSGYYYRTAATATVYTSGGSFVEMVNTTSQSDYY